MKFVWEPQDIRAGRRVASSSGSEQWLIGYDPLKDSDNKWAVISLTDGMIAHQGRSQADLATIFNASFSNPLDL